MCSTYKNPSELTCYKCKNRGHIAKDCPSKKEKIKAILREDASRQQVTKQVEIHPEVCEPREHITTISSDQEKLSQEALKKDQELKTTHSLDTQATSDKEENQVTSKPYSILCENSCSNDCLIHLSLSKSIEKVSGTITFQEEASTMEKTFVDRNHTMENKLDQQPTQGDSKHLKIKSTNQKSGRGVIMSLLIKEEPPDAPLRPQPSDEQTKNRGNLLNSQIIRVTNLTSLCADPTILRTKCSQGGGNDGVTRPVAEPELHQTYHTSRIELNKDTCAFLGAYGMSQDDSDHETTWRTFSGHLEHATKKNQPQSFPDEEDIEVTNRQTSNGHDGDMRPLIEAFRLNQEEPINKSTWFRFSTHQKHAGNWIQVQINYGLKVIQLLNRETLDLPYLEAHRFNHLQRRLWRPGENFNHLRAIIDVLRCTSNQGIRRILPHLQFPYSELSLPYLPYLEPKEFKHQRLFLCHCCCVLDALLMHLDVPKLHNFQPKLSRLKHHQLTIFGRFLSLSLNGYILPNCMRFLSVF